VTSYRRRMVDQNQGDIVMPKEYEFDINDNEVFNGTSKVMKFVSIFTFIFGLLYLLSGIMSLGAPIQGVVNIAMGICMIMIASWLWGAAVSFKMIVVTEGNDITNLMYAIKKLRSVYTLQAWLIGIVCVLFVLLLLLLFTRSGVSVHS
jgi:hypothetical protein